MEDAKCPKENMTGEYPCAVSDWGKSKTHLETMRMWAESSIRDVSHHLTYREDLTANLEKRGAKSDIVESMWKDLGYEEEADETFYEKDSEA